jgi:hypothetical protein
MAQVTGGLVSIEDGKKAAEEFAPARKVRVELSFSVSENEDYEGVFDTVSQAATNRVATLLGRATLSVVQTAPSSGEEAAPAATRKRRTKAEIAADEALAAAGGPSQSGSDGAKPTSADPAAIDEDPTGGADHVIELPDETPAIELPDQSDPAGIEDVDFDAPIEPEVTGDPITDADLNSAVQKKNAEIANPNAIRTIIGSYNPDPTQPFQLRQIPAAKRAEFLSKVSALTKAA